jgi:hypothetical protein
METKFDPDQQNPNTTRGKGVVKGHITSLEDFEISENAGGAIGTVVFFFFVCVNMEEEEGGKRNVRWGTMV